MADTHHFTDRDLTQICASLRASANPHRLARLPDILRDWARQDLPRHFVDDGPIKQRQKQFEDVKTRAQKLLEALEDLGENDRIGLACAIGTSRGYGMLLGCAYADEYFDTVRTLLAELGAGASAAHPKRNRNPIYDIRPRVIRDIAGFFGWVTGKPARRAVDRTTFDETGGFRVFAETIWPPIFGKGDEGLTTAMRKLGEPRHKRILQRELPVTRSSLICEGDATAGTALLGGFTPSAYDLPLVIRLVATRHPEWQILTL